MLTKGKELTASTYRTAEGGGDDIGIKIILKTKLNNNNKDEVNKVEEKVNYLKDKINTFIKSIINKVGNYFKEIFTTVRKLKAKIVTLNG